MIRKSMPLDLIRGWISVFRKDHASLEYPVLPTLLFPSHFPLHAFVEAFNADDDTLMCAVADHLDVVARLHPEGDGAPFDVDDLRRRGDTKADRRRRNVADVD